MWADGKDQEGKIFEQFLDVLGRHDDFRVFCYGSYEKAFLTRMRKQASRKELADKVLKSLVNVLSLVYCPHLLPVLLQRAERRGRLPGLHMERSEGIGNPEPGVAGEVGGDAGRRLEAEAHHLQRGGLCRPEAGDGSDPGHRCQGSPGRSRSRRTRALPPWASSEDLDKLATRPEVASGRTSSTRTTSTSTTVPTSTTRRRACLRPHQQDLRKRTPKQGKSRNGRLRVTRRVTILSREVPLLQEQGTRPRLPRRSGQVHGGRGPRGRSTS